MDERLLVAREGVVDEVDDVDATEAIDVDEEGRELERAVEGRELGVEKREGWWASWGGTG